MVLSRSLFSTAIVSYLAFAATTYAQLSDLPDLATVTDILGATSAESTAATSATSRRATTGGTTASLRGAATKTSTTLLGGLTNAPTLYGVGVPPLIVPDTSGAPFMHKSNLPEGFVFICVGAALAFLGGCVLAWRGLIAWSLHRSVKRAASDRYMSEKKSMYGPPSSYDSTYHSANVSLENLTAKDYSYKPSTIPRKRSRSRAADRERSREPSKSLFFSPTAGGQQNMANQSSTYLPAGYYASTGTLAAAGNAIAHLGGPPASGYGRVNSYSDSPPKPPAHRSKPRYDRSMSRDRLSQTLDSPFRQQYQQQRRSQHLKTSSHGSADRGRAPSAVLDDIFQHSTVGGRRYER